MIQLFVLTKLIGVLKPKLKFDYKKNTCCCSALYKLANDYKNIFNI